MTLFYLLCSHTVFAKFRAQFDRWGTGPEYYIFGYFYIFIFLYFGPCVKYVACKMKNIRTELITKNNHAFIVFHYSVWLPVTLHILSFNSKALSWEQI